MTSNMASSSSFVKATTDAAVDKLRTGLEHKSRGNTAFTSGDIKAALASYHHAVLYLSGLENRSILGLMGENSGRDGKPEDLSSDEEEEDEAPGPAVQSQKELSLVYSNMAACYLKQDNFARAIESAEKALKCDSGNVKAKFRKAQAMRLGGDLYKAQSFLQDTIDGLQSKKGKEKTDTVDSFQRELAAVRKVISQREGMARNKWKGFLGKNPKLFEVDSGSAAGKAAGKDETKAITASAEEQATS